VGTEEKLPMTEERIIMKRLQYDFLNSWQISRKQIKHLCWKKPVQNFKKINSVFESTLFNTASSAALKFYFVGGFWNCTQKYCNMPSLFNVY
jgi:hypothetical protein